MKRSSEKFRKIQGKTRVVEFLFDNVGGPKGKLQHWCFLLEFFEVFQTFFQNTFGRLFRYYYRCHYL